MKNIGVQSIGIKTPIIREGDDLKKIVVDAVLDATAVYNNGYDFSNDEPYWYDIQDKDVIGITESVVARSQGNYVTINDIVEYLKSMNITKNLILYSPIMSRNRFSMILKAFARFADKITIVFEGEYDEQGNPNVGINQFTGVNIQEYYTNLCNQENCKIEFINNKDVDKLAVVTEDGEQFTTRIKYFFNLNTKRWHGVKFGETFIDCRCHPGDNKDFKLSDIMSQPMNNIFGYNSEYGLLGCNKATEEKIKLFPEPAKAQQLVEEIQREIFNKTGKTVEVMVYGDGCFKDPVGGIWEWADPVVSPAYTKGLEGTPNEIKIKAFADDQFKNLSGDELSEAVKNQIKNKDKNLVGNMASQGTTPRRYVDLLGSLMDLTSGSGDKGTPVVLIKNYFNNYSN